jgi:predicted nuclease of restriction endonuclease-like RecB superfamily|tara:strand:+ start:75 stop:512 length:438 start_codon:yes stop_codon:yes gene_type:complete
MTKKKKTSKEESLEWAQKAFDKLKEKKNIKFRSKLEADIASLLEHLGVSYEYESEKLGYTIEHTYTPDFVLPNYTYIEAKGYWSPEDRRKILNVKKDNPDIDLRMVFQAPYNTISKKSKTTYAKWCERHDIPWTSWQNIPLDWLI